MSGLIINIVSPYVTAQRYSEMTGLKLGSVLTKVELGHVPTVKQGKSRLINIAQLTKEAFEVTA